MSVDRQHPPSRDRSLAIFISQDLKISTPAGNHVFAPISNRFCSRSSDVQAHPPFLPESPATKVVGRSSVTVTVVVLGWDGIRKFSGTHRIRGCQLSSRCQCEVRFGGPRPGSVFCHRGQPRIAEVSDVNDRLFEPLVIPHGTPPQSNLPDSYIHHRSGLSGHRLILSFRLRMQKPGNLRRGLQLSMCICGCENTDWYSRDVNSVAYTRTGIELAQDHNSSQVAPLCDSHVSESPDPPDRS